MSWPTNVPPQIDAARTVLAALLAFTSRSYVKDTQVHYLTVDETETKVWPVFVFEQTGRRQIRLTIVCPPTTLDSGQLQTLGQELADQFPSVYRQAAGGLLVAQDPEVSDVGEPSVGMTSAANDLHGIDITLTTGLSRA